MKDTIEIQGVVHDATRVICARYEVHAVTAHRWRNRGLLPNGVRIGRIWYYPRDEVERRMSKGEDK